MIGARCALKSTYGHAAAVDWPVLGRIRSGIAEAFAHVCSWFGAERWLRYLTVSSAWAGNAHCQAPSDATGKSEAVCRLRRWSSGVRFQVAILMIE